MIRFTRVNEAISGTLARLVVKVLRLGSKDVQTALNVANFGVDSSPIKGMVAIHADTGIEGETIILGYIKPDAIAQPGETHIYSTDQDGADSFRIKLLTDGNAEIGGNADNATRYTPLDSGLQAFKVEIQSELVKIATGISGAGGAYTPGTLTVDISGSKIDNIKTP